MKLIRNFSAVDMALICYFLFVLITSVSARYNSNGTWEGDNVYAYGPETPEDQRLKPFTPKYRFYDVLTLKRNDSDIIHLRHLIPIRSKTASVIRQFTDPYNYTEWDLSPIALNSEWNKIQKFCILLVASCLGPTINGYFVATFYVDPILKTTGNVFLACAGISDVVQTSIVMPGAATVILSDEWDNYPVCSTFHFITKWTNYAYNMFMAFAAFELFIRVGRPRAEYQRLITRMFVTTVSVFLTLLSCAIAAIGVFQDMDFDYCRRYHYGDISFRVITMASAHVLPLTFTVTLNMYTVTLARKKARESAVYRKSYDYTHDVSMAFVSAANCVLFVVFWASDAMHAYGFSDTTRLEFYESTWLAMMRSMVTSLIYPLFHSGFRQSFSRLFYYCCCKSSLYGPHAYRHRRNVEQTPSNQMELRHPTHILNNAITNATSHRLAATYLNETCIDF